MLSALSTPKSCPYIEILPENLTATPLLQESLLEKSEILSLHLINSERFAELNSFSLRNFTFVCESDDKMRLQTAVETEMEAGSSEDPLFNVLSLRRGQSECYIADEDPFSNVQQYFIEEPTALIDIDLEEEREFKLQHQSSHMDLHLLPEQEDSSGDSKNLLSSSNEGPLSTKEREPTQAKVSTKNVTKNMGKLLFKYIWKNRISLRKKFDLPAEEWDSFMAQIRAWKKQNNVTRQFLNQRWHSDIRHAKIFRMISHNFFRTRCLSAIIESKIECKEMHMRRLRRFQEATASASALDCLN